MRAKRPVREIVQLAGDDVAFNLLVPCRGAKIFKPGAKFFEAGADGISAHLREDRRHIRDLREMTIDVKVADFKHLRDIMTSLRGNPVVSKVERVAV